jgi:hypothetical protein
MKRLINLFLVLVTALTLSACAAATTPNLDQGTETIGAEPFGP